MAAVRFPTLTLGVCLLPLDASAAPELDALSLRCADFTRLVQDREPEPNEGREILTETPPGFPTEDKYVLGLKSGDELIGVVDILRGYPAAPVWWIGLLLLAPEWRRAGLGRATIEALATWAACEGASALQLGVQSQNEDGLRFWRREGFEHLRTVQRRNGRLTNQVLVMGRPIG